MKFMMIVLIVAGVLMLVAPITQAQTKIIRHGNGQNVTVEGDVFDIPELAVFVAEKEGKLVVDNVMDKQMRPKEYESVDIREGDIILMANGKRMKSIDELRSLYTSSEKGTTLKFGIQREKDMLIVAFDKADPEKLPKRRMIIRKGDGDADDIMIIPNTGLLIGAKGNKVFINKILTDVPSSLTDADVKEGDAVTSINETNVSSFKDFSETFRKVPVGEKVTIRTKRKEKELSFSFTKAEGGPQRIIKRESH